MINKKAQNKLNKIQEKKLKESSRQALIAKLSQNRLSSEQMDKLNSIKNATSTSKKIIEKTILPIKDEIIEQEEEILKEQPKIVNIFQQQAYQAENPYEIHQPFVNERMNESERLEIIAKSIFPDLKLDTFGLKNKLHIEEEQIDINNDDIYDIDPNLITHYDELLKNNMSTFQKQNKTIERSDHIEQQRSQLPILLQENEIIDSIKGNLITLVSGETGCGKSTQIPQFLYEAGFTEYGCIAITQPRRIAAISLAQRVSEETQFKLGQEISYQVKHQNSGWCDKTIMKFMTDGILINELQSNFMLPQYSVIIIDEAHERKVNIDLLIGVLSRVVIARAKLTDTKPLRLIIMSATLRLDDFLNNKLVFPRQLNLIKVQTRQFPVQTFFSKITKENYVEAAIEKCLKIHQTLPAGDILVFLTGQKEIKQCCLQLQNKLESLETRNTDDDEYFNQYDDNEEFEQLQEDEQQQQQQVEEQLYQQQQINNEVYQKSDYMHLKQMIGTNAKNTSNIEKTQIKDFIVLPLYSKLDNQEQQKIFNNNSNNKRMIVIATNVAETSITIPTIRYVVDCGKQKRKVVDQNIGLERHIIDWISQAAADQRSGRAGRTGPGFCYRLYSTAVYVHTLRKFEDPEIMETPLHHLILQMKSIGIKDIFKFPYLSQPNSELMKKGLKDLQELGALKNKQIEENIDNSIITALGEVLSQMPVLPKYGKFLLQSRIKGILNYGVLLVCLLSVEELINKQLFYTQDPQNNQDNKEILDSTKDDDLKEYIQKQEQLKAKQNQQNQSNRQISHHLQQYGDGQRISDLINLMNIVGLFFSKVNDEDAIDEQLYKFAKEHKLLTKSLKEIYYNTIQILEIFHTIVADKKEIQSIVDALKQYQKPSLNQQEQIATLLIRTNGLNKIARLQQILEDGIKKNYYATRDSNVFIHPTSIFYGKQQIEFISYSQLVSFGEQEKQYITNLTQVNDISLLYEMDNRSAQDKKLEIEPNSEWYEESSDRILCWGKAVIFNQWSVDRIKVPLPWDQFGFYSKFAKLLLKGSIIKMFESYCKHYQHNINEIKESNMKPFSQQMIKQLMVNEIHSLECLQNKWKKDQKFLLNEFLLIVKQEYHGVVRQRWPPC